MKSKYRAVERRMQEVGEFVGRLISEHGAHLPASKVAAIRKEALGFAEWFLMGLTVEELEFDEPNSMVLRRGLLAEIRRNALTAIENAFPQAWPLLN